MQTLKRISNRLFYLPPYQETDRPILAAITGEEKTLLIDAGNSSSHAKLFLDQLEERNIKGDLLVLTHWHWDHVFGMREIQAPIIAHDETYNKIKELQELSWEDKELDQRVKEGIEIPFCADAIKKELGNERDIFLPDPDLTFETRMKVNLGGVTCLIEHVGGDHSHDSSIVYIQEEKALFLGDCLYANLYSKNWNYTIDNTLQLIQQIEKYDADIFFLSHHDRPLTKEDFSSFLQLMKSAAFLTKKHEGNEEAVVQEMSESKQRKLSEEEMETITFFVNGFSGN
ncbi:MBL fold metallo-hydrolase [Bacillus aerolatus]|uniref:MBL fold metallo-hydrolase n=1 Tax=Bacillus aerolatus TaxID=2653354 RepID=A0A6I1FFY4_9BACI|nr:MBL fold metallo-hydrolase [Bacillus aerolatus]KAB7707074.1 MBL fold metallo-hydrolase [Bacillus aerolatus]